MCRARLVLPGFGRPVSDGDGESEADGDEVGGNEADASAVGADPIGADSVNDGSAEGAGSPAKPAVVGAGSGVSPAVGSTVATRSLVRKGFPRSATYAAPPPSARRTITNGTSQSRRLRRV